jgi:hypothetical protein
MYTDNKELRGCSAEDQEPKQRLLLVGGCYLYRSGKITERDHQFGLMRDIYSKASRVLIWLGESSKDVDTETVLSVSGVY